MSKKIITLSILLFIVSAFVFSEHIDFNEAQAIAYNWTVILQSEFHEEISPQPGGFHLIIRNGIDTAYVFDFDEKGFLVIPAWDYLPPIKFYTTSFDFNESWAAQEFQNAVFSELEKAITYVSEKKLDSDKSFCSENRWLFHYLRGYHKLLQSGSAGEKEEAGPLLMTRWSQFGPANLKCPVLDGIRAPSGCVATAIAQIMRYHEWPVRGRGNHSYILPGYNIPLSANFDHEYDWDNMLFYYEHENDGTLEEREAISTLLFDVGVSLDMLYTPYWSSANPGNAITALPEYFMYSKEIKSMYRWGYSSDEWFGIAREQIDSGLPIAFTILGSEDGHEVVLDGYRIFEKSKTVHINFGWHGLDDGYYSLENIPDFEDYRYQFYLINIKPSSYRYIKAPENISGVCHANRSLLSTEYHISITWDETLSGEENIEKYIIYRKDRRDRNLGHKVQIGEVAAGAERAWRFITSSFDRWEYEYTVAAVDAIGNKSKNPEWIQVVKVE